MGRIDYLVPLVNFLKASTILNGHGLPDVPDLNNENIFVFSDWELSKNVKNWSYGLIIQPLESSFKFEPKANANCQTIMTARVQIGVQLKNPRQLQQHFQTNVQAGFTTFTGAYPQASALEDLVRETILAYNESIKHDQSLRPLVLVELPEPEESDGYLMMPAIYETEHIF